MKKALIVIDVQNDFCRDGKLPVPNGDEVVKPLNRVIDFAAQNGWEIYFSRDWHPPVTKHFKKWPPHCVQNTPGAEFHPGLYIPSNYGKVVVVSKGLTDADGYSAFDGKMMPKAKKLYVGGLATDYCVLSTVRQALQLGYHVEVMLDACRAVNTKLGDSRKAVREMIALGANMTTTAEVLHGLA